MLVDQFRSHILTDFLKTLQGNGSVNTLQHIRGQQYSMRGVFCVVSDTQQ
jgi:hypothetical protein